MTYYVFVKTKTTTRIFHTFFARISNNNNNATIYNENTKTRNHETTNFSLLSKTLLSLNKKQNKKIKTHNLIFFMMNYLVDKILDSNTNQHFCH